MPPPRPIVPPETSAGLGLKELYTSISTLAQKLTLTLLNPNPAEVLGGTIGRGGAYLSYTRIGYKAILKSKYLDMTHHMY